MNAQRPVNTWQSIGDLAAWIVEEKARQRDNAPGPTATHEKENGDE